MPDAGPPLPDEQQDQTEPRPSAPARKGMFADPMVRRMSIAAVALVVLFLATVVGALMTGVLNPSGPRTVVEKELVVTRAAVEQGSTDPAEWGAYITALVANGQYGRARTVISDARGSIEDSATADISIAEARLLRAQDDDDEVLELLSAAMEQMEAVHEERLAGDSATVRAALRDGLPQNYYIAALIRADIYVQREEWESAIEMYDIYIERHRGAADILVDRGNAKIEIGDTEGAEEDFRSSLRFIPDNEEALEGLDRIGVTP